LEQHHFYLDPPLASFLLCANYNKPCYEKYCVDRLIDILKRARERTLLKDDMASTTSFVKVCPTPEDPISTVGLIA
jgi:hypothetical protein